MAAFLYSVLLSLLDPTSIALALLVTAALLRRRPALRRSFFALSLATLLVCGNGWVVQWMVRSLEWQYLPPEPMPTADAIVILSGSVRAARPPRPTVEVSDAGDRVLYGAELFRRGRAPHVICTGNIGPMTVGQRPEALDMADLLEMIGVPRSYITLETEARNTHEHPVNLCPMFRERQIGRVLLVTSAIHMPRSIAAFRHSCPEVDYIAAPTDFRITRGVPLPWYQDAMALLPTAHALADFSDATHEYIGMLYYALRGWM
jgi:uncharacterized SAM-binding protein YcdF (DUF218 family)